MPYPKPKPKVLPTEGWQYGYVMATPRMDEVTVKKNTPDEQEVEILRVRCITAVPDEMGNVETIGKADIFLYADLQQGGSNWQYLKFLEALGIPMVTVKTATGEEEQLPDPTPAKYVGMALKFEIKHRTWIGRGGEITEAQINSFDSWDGKDPESGVDIEKPERLIETDETGKNVGDDTDEPLPF